MMRDGLVPLLEQHWREFDGPFKWGARDCGTFAARWVEKASGVSILPLLGVYENKDTADAILKERGWKDVRAAADAYLVRREIGFARLGDIVAREFANTGWTLGICNRSEAIFLSLNGGLVRLGLLKCAQAWTVEQSEDT